MDLSESFDTKLETRSFAMENASKVSKAEDNGNFHIICANN